MRITFKGEYDIYGYGWFSCVEDGVLTIGQDIPDKCEVLYKGEYNGDETPYMNEIKKEDPELYNNIIEYFTKHANDLKCSIMENTKFVYAFKNQHNGISIVNHDAKNKTLNSFLAKFDFWGSSGERKRSIDNSHTEVWFEMDGGMWDALHTTTFKNAFERMGVKLVFEYPNTSNS